jgi:PleD family two-component response regulator
VVSFIDQGGHAKLAERVKLSSWTKLIPFFRSFFNTNNAEDVRVHVGNAAKWQCHTVLRVLIIEDSEDDYLLEMHALKQNGYDVYGERVATDVELNKALTKNQWDLVLSDYSMPYLSGIEALHLVRAHDLRPPPMHY